MAQLKMGSAEQFAAIREHFLRIGFTEQSVRQRLEVAPNRELDLPGLSGRRPPKPQVGDSLDAAIYFFVAGEPLPIAEANALFPPAVWDAMEFTQLAVPDPADASRSIAIVALYPIRGLYLASDRWNNPDHSPRTMFPDIVYPALTKSAKQFINYTSFEPCEDFLELCAGTAPAALLAAKTSKNVWATDIAERSLEFAKFNAALNGITNVNFVLGDLFEPMEGRMFDRIAAHPPYVPVLKPAEIFYGGGEFGEEITKRIIAELPARLKPGGRFYCRTLGTVRPNQSFETRIREWLGEKQSEFDVGLFVLQDLEPRQFALEETLNKNGGRDEYAQWEKLFMRNDVRQLVIGVIVIQRAAEARPVFTMRRTIGAGTSAETLDRTMRWEAEMQKAEAFEKLMRAQPIATPGIEIIVRHALRNGQIAPESFTLSIETPFATDCKVQPWMAMLLPRCDGNTTVGEMFDAAKTSGWIVPETPAEEFCKLLATLISGGFLQTEGFRLPAAAG